MPGGGIAIKILNMQEVRHHVSVNPVCKMPMAPLVYFQTCRYLGNIASVAHSNDTSYYAALILAGEMSYQELGREKCRCRRGTLIILPKYCRYSWETYTSTLSFQCQHAGFSLKEHGGLGILFGIGMEHVVSIDLGEDATRLFEDKLLEAPRHQSKELYYSLAVLELFTAAVELFSANLHAAEPGNLQIRRAVYYIEEHLDQPIAIAALAKHCNISERSLFILFNKHLGVPPLGYIAARKIEQAEKLLGSSWLSCGDIAQQLGFSSTNYFVRFVKKHTGLTPLQMRKRAEIRG